MYSNNWNHSIQGASRKCLCRELGLEALSDRCWFQKFTFFYKIVKGLSPRYLVKYVNLNSTSNYLTRSANKHNLPDFPAKLKALSFGFSILC